MFDTKIAIVLRDDLAVWQKLNVTAFLASGLVGSTPELLGERYEDADGHRYSALVVQPMIVMSAGAEALCGIYARSRERNVRLSLFIDDMFSTPHDAANRAAVRRYRAGELPVAGLALRETKKVVDKVTRGARLHP